MLPTIQLGGKHITRLICGGDPISAISHYSAKMDEDMLHYDELYEEQRREWQGPWKGGGAW